MAAPASRPSSSSAMSLPPPGTECRNMTAAAPTASTGTARARRSRECSRIWRTTIRTRIALITYMLMFMPSACRAAPVRGVGRGWESGLTTDLHPRVDPRSCASERSVALARLPRLLNANGRSVVVRAPVWIEIPSARAEASAHVRSRSAWSSRHAARETRASTRRSRRAASIRSLIVTRPACQPRSGNWTP